MKAVVLAAGLGTRLRPLTFFVPKPLVYVAGRPLIDHVLTWLKTNGISEIAVVGHYMQDLLAGYLADFFPDVVFIKSPRLLGTAGQLYYAKKWTSGGDLVVANVDVLTNLDLKMPAELHKAKNVQLTIVATRQATSLRFGVLEIEGDMLKAWREKPTFSHVTSTGVYIASSQLVERLREE
ncbi:MAG: nucleotidyltransferase family protein, partial [Pyrobaculum sp.]